MIALDTNIYIYFLENNLEFFTLARQAIKYAVDSGPVCVPTITLMEIASGTQDEAVLDFFFGQQFSLRDFTREIAVEAGKLRYRHTSLKAADAVHIATAVACGAKQFITNDERLTGLPLGVEVVPLERFRQFDPL